MISIIIPVLNEEETIGILLNHLLENSSTKHIVDIIVVDGGSDDNTKTMVSKFNDVTLLSSAKGRAKQMNSGANQASGSILYFTCGFFSTKNYDHYIISEVNNGNPAGCFKMKFDHKHWWLQLASWFTKFKWRACRGGDQSQFITKQLFDALGRFDESYTIYEDNDLINKLYARKQFVVIQQWITSSARRYKNNGIWTLQYHFLTIYLKKWFGASAEELHQYYRKILSN